MPASDLKLGWMPPALQPAVRALPPEVAAGVRLSLEAARPFLELAAAEADAFAQDAALAGDAATHEEAVSHTVVAALDSFAAREEERWQLTLVPVIEAMAAGRAVDPDALVEAFELEGPTRSTAEFNGFMRDDDLDLALKPRAKADGKITRERMARIARPLGSQPVSPTDAAEFLDRSVDRHSLHGDPYLGRCVLLEGGSRDGAQAILVGSDRVILGENGSFRERSLDELAADTVSVLEPHRLSSGRPPELTASASRALALALAAREAKVQGGDDSAGSVIAFGAPVQVRTLEVSDLRKAATRLRGLKLEPNGAMASALLAVAYEIYRVTYRPTHSALDHGPPSAKDPLIDLGRVTWCRASAQPFIWIPLAGTDPDTVGGSDRPWARGIPAPGASWQSHSPALNEDPDWHGRVVTIPGQPDLFAIAPDGSWWDLDVNLEALVERRRAHRAGWLEAVQQLDREVPRALAEARKLPAAVSKPRNGSPSEPPRFSKTWISETAARYAYEPDDDVLAVGKKARERGYYTRDEFLAVVRWKAARAVPLAEANSEARVESVTAVAFSANTELTRMTSLLSLNGVGVPVASALLAKAFPESYPILDFRALESLGDRRRRTQYPTTFWLSYLDRCRAIAEDAGVSVHLLDKALWQASREGDA